MEPMAPMRPLRVPRRTPRACKQCRAAKIRCHGSAPCERCVRRGDHCVFPSDEPHVSIPESYLKHLERRASAARHLSPDTSRAADSPATDVSLQRQQAEAQQDGISPKTTAVGQPSEKPPQTPQLQQQTPPPTFQQSHVVPVAGSPDHAQACGDVLNAGDEVEPRLQPRTPAPSQVDMSSLSGVTGFVPSGVARNPSLQSGAQENTQKDQSVASPHNPLVSRRLSYIRDAKGRPWYLGPTSTWSFCRRALALLEGNTPPSPEAFHTQVPLNLDGTAFRLKWIAKPYVEPADLRDLPAADYTLYLYSSVRFHLGELFGMVDDLSFLELLQRFQTDQEGTASANRLWFVQYLLVIAFGKAFLGHSSAGAVPAAGPPGSDYASRAMSLMPDAAQMHDEPLPAIEALALAALYFQAIDMRAVAYQYIGQAIRLSYIEGINRQIEDDADAINAPFATRCNNVWWTVYILDRELSSSMGTPAFVSEEDITAALPSERSSSLTAKALTLRVHLARVRGSAYSSVYSVESASNFGDAFVRDTTNILHQLADVSRKLDETMSELKHTIKGDLPHMFRRLMLLYHHCIVLITRPLAMWLLINSLPPTTSTPQQLAHPIASLLQISAESATSTTALLENMADHDMLETFLPFELEYLFSSAMLLSIIGAIIPDYILDISWRRKIMTVLDFMIRKRNVVAPLRKAELEQLDMFLGALQRHHDSRNVLAQPANYPLFNPKASHTTHPCPPAAPPSHERGGPPLTMDADSLTGNNGFEAADTFLSWDTICGPNGDQILGLAEQFEVEDLGMSFNIM